MEFPVPENPRRRPPTAAIAAASSRPGVRRSLGTTGGWFSVIGQGKRECKSIGAEEAVVKACFQGDGIPWTLSSTQRSVNLQKISL